MSDQGLTTIGAFLVFIGIVAIVVIVLFALTDTKKSVKTKKSGGAVLIIGPFPIVFGTDKESTRILLILAIILVVLLFGFYIVQLLFR